MNPAPPETTLWSPLVTADPPVDEAEAAHVSRIVDVPPVDQHRPAHRPLELGHVEMPELVPFGDQHDPVRASGYRICIAPVFDPGQQDLRLLDRRRVVGPHGGL